MKRVLVFCTIRGWVVGYGDSYDEYDDNDNNELSAAVAAPLG